LEKKNESIKQIVLVLKQPHSPIFLSKFFSLFFFFFFSLPFSPALSFFFLVLLFFSSQPRERLERNRERKKERPREMERNRELERRGVRWASHRLGWTTAPGPLGHGQTLVRQKSLEFRHFLGTPIVENPFFLGKYNF
jgi:hypothetical protein